MHLNCIITIVAKARPFCRHKNCIQVASYGSVSAHLFQPPTDSLL